MACSELVKDCHHWIVKQTLHDCTYVAIVRQENAGVGGPAVPPDQMSPRTCGPRTSCPPRHLVLGCSPPPPRTILQRSSTWKCCGSWRDGAGIRSPLQLCGFQSLSNRFFQEPMPHYSTQVHRSLSRGGWSALLLCMQKGLRTRRSVYILSVYVWMKFRLQILYI